MVDRHVAFVAPFLLPATLRFVAAAAHLPGVRLSLITQEPVEKVPGPLRARLVGHWRVDDCLNTAAIVGAVRALSARLGSVERLIGSLEQLQVPLAEARASLALPGVDVETARNFRDKHRMKAVFDAAGLPCARHALVRSPGEAREFAGHAGFPLIVKPPAGAGAVNTFRLNDAAQLEEYLRAFALHPDRPVLFEEFLAGEEHSFDSVVLRGELVWHSISVYSPSPLTVVENPWIQWCVLLPRRIDGPEYAPIRTAGARALAALGLDTGMTHMEWFRRPGGDIAISEVAVRPPGAQFTTLLSHAHSLDFYAAWARLSIFDEFTPPTREFAAGAAYLRGLGHGRVRAVQGIDDVVREFGPLMVEAHWPHVGREQPAGYEGAGYVIFRHPDTREVERALRTTVERVRIDLA